MITADYARELVFSAENWQKINKIIEETIEGAATRGERRATFVVGDDYNLTKKIAKDVTTFGFEVSMDTDDEGNYSINVEW